VAPFGDRQPEQEAQAFSDDLTGVTMIPQQVRQGDVLLRPVQSIAQEGRLIPMKRPRLVLVSGKATGHAHAIEELTGTSDSEPAAVLLEHSQGRRYLFVHRPCLLRHPEHMAIELAPGVYEVVRQREYTPIAVELLED
jgi:hypothetical protein